MPSNQPRSTTKHEAPQSQIPVAPQNTSCGVVQPTNSNKRQEQPRSYSHGPPQIIVKYGERKVAFGRHTVADMGRRQFMRQLYNLWIRKSTTGYSFWELFNYVWEDEQNLSAFRNSACLFGTFYRVMEEDDVGPVELGEIGWAELVQNASLIELIHTN